VHAIPKIFGISGDAARGKAAGRRNSPVAMPALSPAPQSRPALIIEVYRRPRAGIPIGKLL